MKVFHNKSWGEDSNQFYTFDEKQTVINEAKIQGYTFDFENDVKWTDGKMHYSGVKTVNLIDIKDPKVKYEFLRAIKGLPFFTKLKKKVKKEGYVSVKYKGKSRKSAFHNQPL